MTDVLGEHVSPGVIPLEQGLCLSAPASLWRPGQVAAFSRNTGVPVLRQLHLLARSEYPASGVGQPQKHVPPVCAAARYPGESTAEGLAALTPAKHARAMKRGAAANGPYHAYHLTQVGGWRRCRTARVLWLPP